MISLEEKIKRINELYHKSKAEGLTEAEKEEQDKLRREYAANVRANLKGHLDNISIQNADGTIEHLRDRKPEDKVDKKSASTTDLKSAKTDMGYKNGDKNTH